MRATRPAPFDRSRSREEGKRHIRHEAVEVLGRKSHAELRPEVVALVRQLRRKRPKGGQRSLREISAELAQRGIFNERGQPFSAVSINSMLVREYRIIIAYVSFKKRTEGE
jgi:hypothetical protein